MRADREQMAEMGADGSAPGVKERSRPGSGGGREADPSPVHCRVPASDPRRSRPLHPTRRGSPGAPSAQDSWSTAAGFHNTVSGEPLAIVVMAGSPVYAGPLRHHQTLP